MKSRPRGNGNNHMGQMLHFGVVGVGYFGRHYVRLLGEIKGARLSAVSRVSKKYEKEVHSFITKEVKSYQEPEELFQDPKIDCVVIAAPTIFHFELAKRALGAGKHVLLEKPMTRTLEEAELLRRIVEKSGRIFMLGHQYIYNDYINRFKSELAKGSLGKIHYFWGEHLYFGHLLKDIGCFWETATHDLAVVDYLFSPQKIYQVSGKMVSFSGVNRAAPAEPASPDLIGRDDFSSVWIDFVGAPSAGVVVSWLYPEKVRRLSVVGDKGSAVLDEARDEKLKFYFGEKILVPQVKAREPLRNQLLHFIECVRERKKPLTDIEHGIRVIKYLDTIYRTLKKI